MDNTTYSQAAALNADGSHGPLKCGACHAVPVQSDGNGIPDWVDDTDYQYAVIKNQIGGDFDTAVGWAHTYTAEANVLNTTCQNCHGVNGDSFSQPDTSSTKADWTKVASHEVNFLRHADAGLVSRQMMDKAEILVQGHVTGSEPPPTNKNGKVKGNTTSELDTLCTACHAPVAGKGKKQTQPDNIDLAKCSNPDWIQHLTLGRVAESVWEQVSEDQNGGSTCGW
jgi:cytochrome c553